MNPFEKPKVFLESNPKEQAKKVKERLLEAFETGLDDKESIGYHGTSLESIKMLLDKGILPGSSGDEDTVDYGKGALFLFPRKSVFPEYYATGEFSDENALEYARDYAEFLGRYHYIANSLGLDLDKTEDRNVGKSLARRDSGIPGDAEEAKETVEVLVSKKGMSREKINAVLDKSKSRKGVIITFSKNTLDDYKTVKGDDTSHIQDIALICPKGLEYKYISGIEPLGQEEWDFFEKLQKEK